jgi:hypothetical protein
MDKFEKYIRENRLRLDSEEYENEGWDRISGTFDKYNRRMRLRKFYSAAIFISVISVGMLIYVNHQKQTEKLSGTEVFREVATYYKEQEISAIKLINGTEDEIRNLSIPVEYEDMFRDFTKQLQIIDNQYEMYKKEIADHGYNQELIQQVIYNYQLKLSVLQMLQNEINKINNLTKNNRNESKKTRIHI